MRKVSVYLLTALILVNLFGFYAMFMVRQVELKEDMSESIIQHSPENRFEVITYSNVEFAKLSFNDGGKELRVNGKLYDVVRIEPAGENVAVTVAYDAKETELTEIFGSLFSQQQENEQSPSPLKTVISHFQQDYISQQHTPVVFNPTSITSRTLINQSYPYSPFMANKLTPPPQFFLV